MKKLICALLLLFLAASLVLTGCTQSMPEIAQPEGMEGSVNSELTQPEEDIITVTLRDIQWSLIGDEPYSDYFEQALAVCEKLDPNDYEGPDSWERAVVTGMDEYAVVPDYEDGSGYTVRHFLLDDEPTGFISVYLGVVTHRDLVNGTEEVLYKYIDHLDIQEP